MQSQFITNTTRFHLNRDLSNNPITSIASGDFPGLSALTGLWVWLHCDHCTLQYMTLHLRRILYNNQITSIESGSFAGLGALTTLWVFLRGDHAHGNIWPWICTGTWEAISSHQLRAETFTDSAFYLHCELQYIVIIVHYNVWPCTCTGSSTTISSHQLRAETLTDSVHWLHCEFDCIVIITHYSKRPWTCTGT